MEATSEIGLEHNWIDRCCPLFGQLKAQDADQPSWIGIDDHLTANHDGRFFELRKADGHSLGQVGYVLAIAEDADDNIWALTNLNQRFHLIRSDSRGTGPPQEHLSEWLGRAAEEGRAALNSLRTSTTERNDLAEGFQRAIEECRLHSPIDASFAVAGETQDMHPVIRDEVFRIGYEAIRNACAHSHGSRMEVELNYAHDLTVRVTDNGVGIDPSVLDQGRAGHFGLQGMRERAARIGAKLTIVSSATSGTQITAVVPGSIVFRRIRQSPFRKINTRFKRNKRTPSQ